MEVVDQGEVPRVVCVDFLSGALAWSSDDGRAHAYVVRRHLHPFLEVGQQGHNAGARCDSSASNIGHVVAILRRGVWRVVGGGKRHAAASGSRSRSRGAHRVALGLLVRMAAGSLFLAVVVERHSASDGLA